MDTNAFEKALETVNKLGEQYLFDEARTALLELAEHASSDPARLLNIADTFESLGLVSDAEYFAHKTINAASNTDPAALIIKKMMLYLLGHIAAQVCDQDICDKIGRSLLSMFPNDQEVLIYLIRHQSYNPKANPAMQKTLAEYWAQTVAIAHRPRPMATPLAGRKLRVGYVSGDLSMHPVGLFIHGVLLAHDRSRFELFTYNANPRKSDPLEQLIRKITCMRDVAGIHDDQLDSMIREDAIDVLVDLSGFTTNTRLAVFAREPAPVLISWLGYWATTGLSCLDGFLLDKWHAYSGCEADYTEPVIQMPCLRFCYQPLFDVAVNETPPCLTNGFITFGCFNTTCKINSKVLDVWAEILQCIPDSHLFLKWKTLNDQKLRERFRTAFARRGIDPKRIIFSGWSSLATMFEECSAKVDIALDPFPFPGGITTCNALWMGIPVVTLSGETAISRQGEAILSQLDLQDLVARNEQDYIHIACGLAQTPKLLSELRKNLRSMMNESPLRDVAGFTRHLETIFLALYTKRLLSPPTRERYRTPVQVCI